MTDAPVLVTSFELFAEIAVIAFQRLSFAGTFRLCAAILRRVGTMMGECLPAPPLPARCCAARCSRVGRGVPASLPGGMRIDGDREPRGA